MDGPCRARAGVGVLLLSVAELAHQATAVVMSCAQGAAHGSPASWVRGRRRRRGARRWACGGGGVCVSRAVPGPRRLQEERSETRNHHASFWVCVASRRRDPESASHRPGGCSRVYLLSSLASARGHSCTGRPTRVVAAVSSSSLSQDKASTVDVAVRWDSAPLHQCRRVL